MAVVPGGEAGFRIESEKKNGSIDEATAFPFASVSWKLLVPGVPVKRRLKVRFVNFALVPLSAFEALKMP